MAAATDGWEAEDAKPIAPRVSHGSTGSHAASGPMSLGRSSSRGSQGSAGSHGSTHHGDNSHGTHATKSGSGGWDDEEDDEDAGWDEGDSWQPGPSTPNPPKPSRTAVSGPSGGRRIEGMGSKGSRSGAACLRTSRYLRRGIICGGVLAIVVMGAAAYRYIADGGDGLHSKHLDVEFELDDQAVRSSSFGSSSSPSERLSGGASLSRLAHPNAAAGVDGYRSPADRDAVVVEEGAGDEGSTPIRAPSPKIAEASSKEETAQVKNTRVAPKTPNREDEETDLDNDLKGLRGSNAPTPVPGGDNGDDDVDARARPSDDEDETVREEAAGDQTKKVEKSKTEDEPRAPSLDDETKVPTSKSSSPQHASGKPPASDTKADGDDDVFEPEESDDKNKSDDKKRPATKTQDEEPKDPKDSKDGDGDSGADSGADSASPAAKTNATKEEKEPLIVSVEDGEDHADVPPSAKSEPK